MKKKFKLEDLDCANCAAKMEDAIKKIPGVNDASVSFMTQKMSIDAEDAKFDEIMKEVVAVCAKVEPDCKIFLIASSIFAAQFAQSRSSSLNFFFIIESSIFFLI